MKGYMRQRGGSWELRVYLGRDPLTGKKRYSSRTFRGGKREAQSALATPDDAARLAYTHGALSGLQPAMVDGVDVRGYLHWSPLDNFEWTAGFAKTFGLLAFDPETFERRVKPSARWLGRVARAGAVLPIES